MYKQLSADFKTTLKRISHSVVVLAFLFSSVILPGTAQANNGILLPQPGAMLGLTPTFNPLSMQGILLNTDNPLELDFIINEGDVNLEADAFKEESLKLIKYFMVALTMKEEDMWVNLSPYEKDRLIPDMFGQTEMGRDLLAQDYLLKQLTASLGFPGKELGQKFWQRVFERTQEEFGTTDIPMNTFNKVWIVPESANIYEHDRGAYLVNSRLKVLLEEDYLASDKFRESQASQGRDLEGSRPSQEAIVSGVSSQIIREILIPEIEKEVNEGETFAELRQAYDAVLLATWYKINLKESILGKVYAEQGKIVGIDENDPELNQKIYDAYIEAFKKGVYNYIKEDFDAEKNELVPRKYFSGGAGFLGVGGVVRKGLDSSGSSGIALAEKFRSLKGSLAKGLTRVVTVALSPERTYRKIVKKAQNMRWWNLSKRALPVLVSAAAIASFSSAANAEIWSSVVTDNGRLDFVQIKHKSTYNDRKISSAEQARLDQLRPILLQTLALPKYQDLLATESTNIDQIVKEYDQTVAFLNRILLWVIQQEESILAAVELFKEGDKLVFDDATIQMLFTSLIDNNQKVFEDGVLLATEKVLVNSTIKEVHILSTLSFVDDIQDIIFQATKPWLEEFGVDDQGRPYKTYIVTNPRHPSLLGKAATTYSFPDKTVVIANIDSFVMWGNTFRYIQREDVRHPLVEALKKYYPSVQPRDFAKGYLKRTFGHEYLGHGYFASGLDQGRFDENFYSDLDVLKYVSPQQKAMMSEVKKEVAGYLSDIVSAPFPIEPLLFLANRTLDQYSQEKAYQKTAAIIVLKIARELGFREYLVSNNLDLQLFDSIGLQQNDPSVTLLGRSAVQLNAFWREFDRFLYQRHSEKDFDLNQEIIDFADQIAVDLLGQSLKAIDLEGFSNISPEVISKYPVFLDGASGQKKGDDRLALQYLNLKIPIDLNLLGLSPEPSLKEANPENLNGQISNEKLESSRGGPFNNRKKEEASSAAVGGIDLNTKELQVNIEGQDIQFQLPSPEELLNMSIDGFVPIIININTITNLPLLLGLDNLSDSELTTANLNINLNRNIDFFKNFLRREDLI